MLNVVATKDNELPIIYYVKKSYNFGLRLAFNHLIMYLVDNQGIVL